MTYKGPKKTFELLNLLIILIMVMVSWMYIDIGSMHIKYVQLGYVNYTSLKLFKNKH